MSVEELIDKHNREKRHNRVLVNMMEESKKISVSMSPSAGIKMYNVS